MTVIVVMSVVCCCSGDDHARRPVSPSGTGLQHDRKIPEKCKTGGKPVKARPHQLLGFYPSEAFDIKYFQR